MGLLPEFFTLLGIVVFLAVSLLSALLEDDFPRILRYILQGAAMLGLGELFIAQNFINSGGFSRDPADPTRFWIGVVYLASAVSSVFGMNVYLALVRRRMALARMLTGSVAVPVFAISALFVSSFLGTGGEIVLTPATVVIVTASVFILGVSLFDFFGEASRDIWNVLHLRGLSPVVSASMSSAGAGPGVSLPLPSVPGEDWEESPRKVESEEQR